MPSDSFRPRSLGSSLALFEAWTEYQMAHAGLPGLSIALIRDQETVWARGFGHGDRHGAVPAGPESSYRVASITKLFTATAVLQLRDAGALLLDDPVRRHLDWFDPPPAGPGDRPITVRHLLTHTSGLPREAPLPYWNDGHFPDTRTLRELVGRLRPTLPPETAWKYSNLGFALAGEVVAAVTRMPYARYLERYVLEPLRLTSTRIDTPDPDDAGLVAGHGRRLPDGSREESPHSDSRALGPAANLTTTALDLARFAKLQFRDGPTGGAQILAGTTLREMHRVHWLDPDWQRGWGLGFSVQRSKGRTYLGHGGSLRGYRSLLRLRPDDRIGVVVLTNADDGEPQRYADAAFEWLAPQLDRVGTGTNAPSGDLDGRFAPYLGRYRNSWRDLQVLVLDGRLILCEPGAPDPPSQLAELEPAGEHAFRLRSDDGYSSRDEEVAFALAGERATRIRIGATGAERIERW